MFIGNGRAAFLEFLRNLTPQVVFLTLALIVSLKINFQVFQPDLEGLKTILPFAICILVFFASFIANTTKFIESAISSNEELDKEVKAIYENKLGFWKKISLIFQATLKLNKKVFIEIILCIIFSYAGFYVASSMAIQGAISAVKALQ